MPRPLGRQVVVITGASAGIGRATALECARRGASLVLAARTTAALDAVAHTASQLGAAAQVVTTDITQRDQVDRLAHAAVERFGRIDTWVNNAGGTAYATVEEMPIEEIEAQVQLSLLGPIYGMKAALVQMRRQGYGTIVNVGSALSNRAVPLQGAYCAAKHGLKGITDALRLELKQQHAGIDVVLVMPVAIASTFFEHAPSHLGGQPSPIPPVYPPEAVARAIARVAEKPSRYVYVGRGARMLGVLDGLSPALLDWYMLQGDRLFKVQQPKCRDDSATSI